MASPFPIAFGPYVLERFIAKGGMAEVFLARSSSIEGGIALKRMLPEMMKSAEYVTMFRDEARLSQRLVHDNIVRVFDSGDVDGQLYMAMEYVDGLDVGTLQRKLRHRGEMLGIGHALRIGVEMCAGLAYAHAQKDDRGQPLHLIHRDVSPQNVMVSATGAVKVTDFGIAKAVGRETRTQTGLIKGKVPYMSPEQALGQDIDQRLDQFAAGIVVWEMLTGARLYNEKSELLTFEKIIRHPPPRPSSARTGVPPLVDGAVQRALAKNPDARFPDIAAFGNALAEALSALDAPSQLAPVMQHVMSNREGSLQRAVAVTPPPQSSGARKGGLVVAKPGALDAGLAEAPTLSTPSRANPAMSSPSSSPSSSASSGARPKTSPGTTSPFIRDNGASAGAAASPAAPGANDAGADTLAVESTLDRAPAEPAVRPPSAVVNGPDVREPKSRTPFLAIAGALIVGLGLGFAAAKAMPSESKTGLGGCPLSSSDPAVAAAAASSLAAAQDAYGAKNADLAQRLATAAEQKSGSAAGEMFLGKIALERGERAAALDHMKCVFALDPSSREAAELERKLK